MGRPALLVEDLYSTTQFPAHVVAANAEAAGNEAWRVADGRRAPGDRWSPTAANAVAWLRVTCDVARTVDMLALDRGHNLAGAALQLQTSVDGGTTWTTRLTTTPPAAAAVAGLLDAANGVTTEEGAWLKRFAPITASDWRLRVPALGAGLVPRVVGLWIGQSWAPSQYLDLPWGEDDQELLLAETTTPAGWRGTSSVARVRVGELTIKLGSPAEYVLARYHVRNHFHARRRPMWICYDDAQAERAVLAVPPAGRLNWRIEQGWTNRQAVVSWIEHEPRIGA